MTEKMEQADVNYRVGETGNECSSCVNFIEEGECTLVNGTISPKGLCDLFTPLEQQGGPDQGSIESMLFGGGM